MLTLTVVTATLSFNVLPLTLATAMLNVNVLPLKVATATVSFNVLPLTLNVNVLPFEGCNCNGKCLHVDTKVCNCFNGCKCKA